MRIVWFGLNTFHLSERGMASVVTDPYGPGNGLPLPRISADIVTISQDDSECGYTESVRGPYRVLDTPGEYEISHIFITGVATFTKGKNKHRNIVFHFNYDGLTICHLGHLTRPLTQAHVETLGTVDVLLIPVGGDRGLKPAQTSEVVSLLEPSIVVPMRYKIPGLDVSLGGLDRFLKQMGIGEIELQDELEVSRTSLPSEIEIVALRPQTV